MTNGHSFFRKIYLIHFIRNGCKRVMCESWRLNKNCNILTPGSSGYSSTSFSSCGAARPLLGLVLTASNCNNWLQTPNRLELPVIPGYIIVWHPPVSCGRHICTEFNSSTVKVIPRYLRLDAPFIYTGILLIWKPDLVGGQYVTVWIH